MMMVEGQAHLLEIVLAGDTVGRLANLLHSGQQKPNQDADNGDHDQQLDKRERSSTVMKATW
jgi:hypothetical protein